MAYRTAPKRDFRCGRYPAAWVPGRLVTSKAASYRFEIVAGQTRRNVNDPAEALRIARTLYGVGGDVSVRDRSKRRGYLTEIELQEMTDAQRP